jgi:DNA-binding NtrC family response regulator
MHREAHQIPSPPPLAVLHGTVERDPLALLVVHLLEREGLDVRCAASPADAGELARDPRAILVIDLDESTPEPLSLPPGVTPVRVTTRSADSGTKGESVIAIDRSRLVASLPMLAGHAKDLATAITQLRLLGDSGASGAAPGTTAFHAGSEWTNGLGKTIASLAATQRPVIVHGPAGSGKKHAARMLHAISPRSRGPFLALDAREARVEAILPAHGGTLALAGVEECPGELGPVLVSLAEERRIGSRVVDARLLLLTRDEPRGKSLAGRLPQALLHASCELRLPALHERPEELIALADDFLASEAAKRQRAPFELSLGAVERLLSHAWPGNVRELRAACEHAAIAAGTSPRIEPEHFPASLEAGRPRPGGAARRPTLANAVDAVERELIARAISAHRGKLDEVSRALGVAPRTLRRKILQHGLRGEARSLRQSA